MKNIIIIACTAWIATTVQAQQNTDRPSHVTPLENSLKTQDLQQLQAELKKRGLQFEAGKLVPIASEPPGQTDLNIDGGASGWNLKPGLLQPGALAGKDGKAPDPTVRRQVQLAPESPAPDPELSLAQTWLKDSAEVKQAYLARIAAGYLRDAEILAERKEAFAWQAWVSKFIFWAVHAILFVAVLLSVIEFFHAFQTRRQAPTAKDALEKQHLRRSNLAGASAAQTAHFAEPPGSSETEFKLSLEGIALKTALHGLAILAIALAFYFLYLKFVYPIETVR